MYVKCQGSGKQNKFKVSVGLLLDAIYSHTLTPAVLQYLLLWS